MNIITETKNIGELEELAACTENTMVPVMEDGKTKRMPAKLLTAGQREQIAALTKEYELYAVTAEDVMSDTAFELKVIEAGSTPFSSGVSLGGSEGHCYYAGSVKKGDSLVLTNAFSMESDCPDLVVTNADHIIINVVPFSALKNELGQEYIFPEDGEVHLCFDYTTCTAGEFFYIKRPSVFKPLVIDANKANDYLTDPTVGDEALNAIMRSRQIRIRVPNADGGKYTAVYSPVLMYQLPNYMNNYLYLFFLNDGVDSTTGMPTYGQLKLLLSRTYNMTPLT